MMLKRTFLYFRIPYFQLQHVVVKFGVEIMEYIVKVTWLELKFKSALLLKTYVSDSRAPKIQ